MTSQGSLCTYVKELVFSGKNWPYIKPLLQSRFSECGDPTLAKHKLNLLKQGALAMHDYNDEYARLLENAYNFQPTDLPTVTLISSYIQGITNPHIRSKLRTAKANILQDIFTLALEEESQSFGI